MQKGLEASLLQTLLDWCKKMTNGYQNVNVTNFTSSWRNGLAFCALMHRYNPQLLDFASLSKDNSLENNRLAFEAGEALGVPALLDPEDMIVMAIPDKISVVTYLSTAFCRLKDRNPTGGPHVVAKHAPRRPSICPTRRQSKIVLQKEGTSISEVMDICEFCKKRVHLIERYWIGPHLYHRNCYVQNTAALSRMSISGDGDILPLTGTMATPGESPLRMDAMRRNSTMLSDGQKRGTVGNLSRTGPLPTSSLRSIAETTVSKPAPVAATPTASQPSDIPGDAEPLRLKFRTQLPPTQTGTAETTAVPSQPASYNSTPRTQPQPVYSTQAATATSTRSIYTQDNSLAQRNLEVSAKSDSYKTSPVVTSSSTTSITAVYPSQMAKRPVTTTSTQPPSTRSTIRITTLPTSTSTVTTTLKSSTTVSVKEEPTAAAILKSSETYAIKKLPLTSTTVAPAPTTTTTTVAAAPTTTAKTVSATTLVPTPSPTPSDLSSTMAPATTASGEKEKKHKHHKHHKHRHHRHEDGERKHGDREHRHKHKHRHRHKEDTEAEAASPLTPSTSTANSSPALVASSLSRTPSGSSVSSLKTKKSTEKTSSKTVQAASPSPSSISSCSASAVSTSNRLLLTPGSSAKSSPLTSLSPIETGVQAAVVTTAATGASSASPPKQVITKLPRESTKLSSTAAAATNLPPPGQSSLVPEVVRISSSSTSRSSSISPSLSTKLTASATTTTVLSNPVSTPKVQSNPNTTPERPRKMRLSGTRVSRGRSSSFNANDVAGPLSPTIPIDEIVSPGKEEVSKSPPADAPVVVKISPSLSPKTTPEQTRKMRLSGARMLHSTIGQHENNGQTLPPVKTEVETKPEQKKPDLEPSRPNHQLESPKPAASERTPGQSSPEESRRSVRFSETVSMVHIARNDPYPSQGEETSDDDDDDDDSSGEFPVASIVDRSKGVTAEEIALEMGQPVKAKPMSPVSSQDFVLNSEEEEEEEADDDDNPFLSDIVDKTLGKATMFKVGPVDDDNLNFFGEETLRIDDDDIDEDQLEVMAKRLQSFASRFEQTAPKNPPKSILKPMSPLPPPPSAPIQTVPESKMTHMTQSKLADKKPLEEEKNRKKEDFNPFADQDSGDDDRNPFAEVESGGDYNPFADEQPKPNEMPVKKSKTNVAPKKPATGANENPFVTEDSPSDNPFAGEDDFLTEEEENNPFAKAEVSSSRKADDNPFADADEVNPFADEQSPVSNTKAEVNPFADGENDDGGGGNPFGNENDADGRNPFGNEDDAGDGNPFGEENDGNPFGDGGDEGNPFGSDDTGGQDANPFAEEIKRPAQFASGTSKRDNPFGGDGDENSAPVSENNPFAEQSKRKANFSSGVKKVIPKPKITPENQPPAAVVVVSDGKNNDSPRQSAVTGQQLRTVHVNSQELQNDRMQASEELDKARADDFEVELRLESVRQRLVELEKTGVELEEKMRSETNENLQIMSEFVLVVNERDRLVTEEYELLLKKEIRDLETRQKVAEYQLRDMAAREAAVPAAARSGLAAVKKNFERELVAIIDERNQKTMLLQEAQQREKEQVSAVDSLLGPSNDSAQKRDSGSSGMAQTLKKLLLPHS